MMLWLHQTLNYSPTFTVRLRHRLISLHPSSYLVEMQLFADLYVSPSLLRRLLLLLLLLLLSRELEFVYVSEIYICVSVHGEGDDDDDDDDERENERETVLLLFTNVS